MERRIRALERIIPPAFSPEIRALAERLAVEDGRIYTADELLAETQGIIRAIGEPFTAARAVAWLAKEDGIPEADLWAAIGRDANT